MDQLREALLQADRFLRLGDLPRADQAYRQILAGDPAQSQAWHGLGLVAYEAGQFELAVAHVSHAVRLNGSEPAFHLTLGEAFRRLNRPADAMTSYRQALRIKPDFANAHNNIGALLEQTADMAAAIEHYREAIRLNPYYADARHNLGLALRKHRPDEAAEHLAEAVRLAPDNVGAAVALGGIYTSHGRAEEGRALFERYVASFPLVSEVHCGLGVSLQLLGDPDAAIACYRRAIELEPANAEAHYNLGAALVRGGRDLEAIASYQEAVRLNPRMALGWSNLANVYLGLVRPDEAVAAAREALRLDPTLSKAMGNLATALEMQGDLEGSIDAFRRTVKLSPQDSGNRSNLLYSLNFHPAYDAQTIFREHLAWAEQHAEPLTRAALPHLNDRSPDRRLKVGYVSAHFRHHAVSFFSWPLIAAHDHEQFEITCYSDARPDAVTERFRGVADQWRETGNLSDEQLAQLVHRDQIDILVDLAGHIGGCRLLAFARRPAPVQVTYLGYQNTTGMSAMNYRLTDAHADPPGETDRYYTERLVRLPGAFFCYAPHDPSPPVGPPAFEKEGRITFASLNNVCKLTPQAFRVWAEILKRVPDSRLVLLAYTPGAFERTVRAAFAAEGVDPARIEVTNKRPTYDYLQLHEHLDIALDTFPFNGHTTVCDALWMGVPSVMLEGTTYASRFGGSTLLGVGLGELIAHSAEEYVEIAVTLAQDRERLARLRAELRDRLRNSPLVDATSFARGVESVYRQMWRDWCASGK